MYQIPKCHKFCSIGWDGHEPIVGTENGFLHRFFERKIDFSVHAHSAPIRTICSTNTGFASGSEDGIIKLWKSSLICMQTFDMKESATINQSIHTICWCIENNKILVGTSGNEIWELRTNEGKKSSIYNPIVFGHFEDNLSGLSVCPQTDYFATVGHDKSLRIWTLSGNKMVNYLPLEMSARSCTYSPCGTMIAIGFGCLEKKNAKEFHGKWIIIEIKALKVIFEIRDSRKMITEIKWSPDGKYIAVGSWDNNIYLYSVKTSTNNQIEVLLSSVLDQHKSYITHIDFSSNSEYLRTNCGAYELKFFEVETGLHVPAASRLKDVEWDSETCILAWAVQGAWSRFNDGVEVEAVDCTACQEKLNGSLVVSGDNFGRIKFYRYPCVSQLAMSQSFRGHSGSVSNIRWSDDGRYAISTGREDQAIMIWEVNKESSNENSDLKLSNWINENRVHCNNEAEFKNSENMLSHCRYLGPSKVQNVADISKEQKVRQWIRAIVPPTNYTMGTVDEVEDISIDCLHCFGCESELSRDNIHYDEHGKIVYHMSNFSVVFSKDKNTQSIGCEHEGLVSCLTLTKSKRLAASGETASRPTIKIWDVHILSEIVTLTTHHRNGIESLSFSTDAKKLVSIGAEFEHYICVWRSISGEWHDVFLQCKAECGVEPILFTNFQVSDDNNKIYPITGGEKHISFWQYRGSHLLQNKIYPKNNDPDQTFLCGLSIRKRYVVGCTDGHLLVWENANFERNMKVHQFSVTCLHSYHNGFLSGDIGGNIVVWSNMLEVTKTFDIKLSRIKDFGLTSLSTSVQNSQNNLATILIGTKGSEIYEFSVPTERLTLIQSGHFKGELRGLACHPSDKDLFATCGGDGNIHIWSISQRKSLKSSHQSGSSIHTVCWSNNGCELLVGCGKNGDESDYDKNEGVVSAKDKIKGVKPAMLYS